MEYAVGSRQRGKRKQPQGISSARRDARYAKSLWPGMESIARAAELY